MPTIERKPLPPPNSTATTITEADRADIVARANEVIDHYLNGPGSYWESGPRKPLHESVNDLEDFKNRIIASKQFADDPHSIMDSVIDLVDRTMQQVGQAARNNEGSDSITLPPPDTDDPIDAPRAISPRLFGNAALPVSLPLEGEQSVPSPQTGGMLGASSDKPVRYLGRRIAGQSQTSTFDTGTPASPFVPSQNQNSPMGLPGLIAAALARSDPPELNQLVPSPPYDAPHGFTNNDPAQPWFFQGWR
jgi:hypothetical protein